MRNYDLQIIWSAQDPFIIPGVLALHVQIEAKRSAVAVYEFVEKWFADLKPEDKISMSFVHLN